MTQPAPISSNNRAPGVSRPAVLVLVVGGLLLVALAIWGSWVAAYAPLAVPGDSQTAAGVGPAEHRGPLGYRWLGAIHVHSALSDGAGDVGDIIDAAAAVGLDFVVLSDHNPLGESRAADGWYGDVLLIVGEEVSTREGHLLALEVPPHRYRLGPRARQALDDIEELGGWALAAHPAHASEPWRAGWGRLEGLEVVNFAGSWSRAGWPARLTAAAAYPFNPMYAAQRLLADSPSLALWDSKTALSGARAPRPLVAVGSADAHGPVGPARAAPSYESALGAVQILVWADVPPGSEATAARRALLDALRAGHAATLVAAIGAAPGFVFCARAAGDPVPPGRVAAWEAGPWVLEADLGRAGPYQTVLIRDGEPVASAEGEPLRHEAERAGTYRVEVYRMQGAGISGIPGSTPLVISNPIYLWPGDARTAAVLHRAPPVPAAPIVDNLLTVGRWRAESGGDAINDLRRRRRSSLWTIGLPDGGDERSFAALAWRPDEQADWSARAGLVVALQSHDTLRLTLEVRGLTPEGQTRSWYGSVKANLEGTPTTIPFSALVPGLHDDGMRDWLTLDHTDVDRPAHQATPSDLARVTVVYLVVTPRILAPGSNASIRISSFGVF